MLTVPRQMPRSEVVVPVEFTEAHAWSQTCPGVTFPANYRFRGMVYAPPIFPPFSVIEITSFRHLRSLVPDSPERLPGRGFRR